MKREKAYIRLPVLLLSGLLFTTQGCSFEDIFSLNYDSTLENQQPGDYLPEEGEEIHNTPYYDETEKEEGSEEMSSLQVEHAENVSEMYYGYY